MPGTEADADLVDCFGFRPVTLDEIRIRLAENAAREEVGFSTTLDTREME